MTIPDLGWIDSHCHLPDSPESNELIDEATAAGVTAMVVVGTDWETSRRAVTTAATYPEVRATVGVHPHDAAANSKPVTESEDWVRMLSLFDEPGVVAVGECGLDFHYDYSPRDIQKSVFAAQVEISNRLGLPLVIHTREAWEETFEVLDKEGVPDTTVFHCFTGGAAEAEQCLERAAYLSFSGIVTFKTADDIRSAALLCPTNRLLVETDSPYLAPVPHRGKPNRPALVAVVGAGLAAAIGVSVEEVAAATSANARRVFNIA